MGLPEINIAFKSKSVSAITRSAMGIVALILRDATLIPAASVVKIKSVEDLKPADWTAGNHDYIEKTLLGTPSQVLVLRIGEEDLFVDALKKLGALKFNYVAVPGATTEETATLASWIKSKRANDKKTLKAIVANQEADDAGVINFTTGGIVVGDKTYTAQQYTARIAGILAGLPFTRSATYFVLPEVDEIEDHEDANADIDAGQLILVNDGEKVKIGRGVNSLTTLTIDMKADWKKIKIVEVMDMITDDIRDTFNDNFVGKVPNITDNQFLFIISVKSYFKGLANESILDVNYDNTAEIDVATQRLAWESTGIDTTTWDETKVRLMTFGSAVFLGGNVKIVDAIEDLDFNIFSA
ncbi:MAG: phage tail sheath C-terminal domain-containing protein [Lysinibacillus sp.]